MSDEGNNRIDPKGQGAIRLDPTGHNFKKWDPNEFFGPPTVIDIWLAENEAAKTGDSITTPDGKTKEMNLSVADLLRGGQPIIPPELKEYEELPKSYDQFMKEFSELPDEAFFDRTVEEQATTQARVMRRTSRLKQPALIGEKVEVVYKLPLRNAPPLVVIAPAKSEQMPPAQLSTTEQPPKLPALVDETPEHSPQSFLIDPEFYR